MRRMVKGVGLVLSVVLLCFGTKTTHASENEATNPGRLEIELNSIAPQDGACRLSFLVKNRLKQKVSNLILELAIFDSDGRITRLLSASVGRLPDNKSRLKQYDVPDLTCDQIGRILLNDVTQCDGDKLTPELCTSATVTKSRARVPFEY